MKDKELKVILSLDEVNQILGSLAELPFKLVNGTIQKITTQVQSQLYADNNTVEEVKSEKVN